MKKALLWRSICNAWVGKLQQPIVSQFAASGRCCRHLENSLRVAGIETQIEPGDFRFGVEILLAADEFVKAARHHALDQRTIVVAELAQHRIGDEGGLLDTA